MNLEKLIKPKSIAVVGVTDKPGFGRGAANGAMMSRIADHAYFVHPKREELHDAVDQNVSISLYR